MTGKTLAREYLCSVVRSALLSEPLSDIPEGTDKVFLVKLAYRNSVQVILYLAFKDKPGALPQEYMSKLERSYKAAILRESSQQNELNFIRKAFAENNIDFMCLKGAHLKALYPVPEMRFMVDMDILVKKEDVLRAEKLLTERGFSREMNNGKDIVLINPPFLTVELHNMLFIESDIRHDYFTDVWKRAVKCGEHEYKMTGNDLYIYVMAHLAEHYKDGGACFRPTMDIFMLNRLKSEELDFTYIGGEFEKIGLARFAENIKKVGDIWFGDAKDDKALFVMQQYIVLGPPIQNAGAVAENMESTRFSAFMRMAFPPLKVMVKNYPVLKRLPFLLPFYWLVRLVKKGGRAKNKSKELGALTDKNKKLMNDIFKSSGL